MENLLDAGAVGVGFVWTELDEFLILLLFGILTDVIFVTEAEWADYGEGHLLHAEFGGHGGEMALEGEVHQGGVDDVVLVVAEGNLGAAKLLSEVEELLAALPGAEEAGGLGLGA